MKLTGKSETFKELIGIVDGINTLELRLHIEEDKIWYKTVDTGNVALVSAEIPIDAFTEHTFDPCILCIDVVKFKKAFQFGGKEITITKESAESNSIVVESGGYIYTQTLLHDTTVKKDPNMPNLELPGRVEINGKDFGEAVKIGSGVADKLWLEIINGVFKISAIGEGNEKLEKPFQSDELLHIEGEGKSLFSFDYLLGMLNTWKGDIKIELGIDHPVVVSFYFAGGHGVGKFLLAPRIEQD